MGYRYKWKPSKAQVAEYKAKCAEREAISPRGTNYAIRTGCFVKFYSMNTGSVIEGQVISESYGADKGQHTFTIDLGGGEKLLVKGRNLYPNIIEHTQGILSKLKSK